MKSILLAIALFTSGLGVLNAQITGGGVDKSNNVMTNNRPSTKNGVGYFTFNWVNPVGNFGNEVFSEQDILIGNGGMSRGFGLNIGKMYYLNSIELMEGFKLGIDWTIISANYLWGYNPDLESDEFSPTIILATKLGPGISYNIIGNLMVDASFTFQPTYIFYSNDLDGYDEFGYYTNISISGSGFKVRPGFGAYVSYKPIRIGFETSWGKAKMNFTDEEKTTMPTNTFNLVFGFAF